MHADNKKTVTAKKGLRWPVIIVMLGAAFIAGHLFRLRDPGHQDESEHTTHADSADTAAPLYYCSMHPQVRSPDKNDKCPICFMDLIPLPDDDADSNAGDAPRLQLSRNAAALMELRTWPAERRRVTIELALYGQVAFDESRLHNIPVKTDAYVERLIVKTPWQAVSQGEPLAELYSPAVVTAMRELVVARERNHGTELERITAEQAARKRLERFGVTSEQIDEIERSADVPREFRLNSPISGVVLDVSARQGDWLREGELLTRVVDLSHVWINLESYERDLVWIAVGQTARISLPSSAGDMLEATVSFVEPVIDPRSRTARVRVQADNAAGILKPGMYVTATIQAAYPPAPASDAVPEHSPAEPVVIPITAPLITGKRALVYVRLPDQERPTFEPRPIVLGPRAGDVYIVREGLQEGELVVVNGQFKIDSELQIRGRSSMMAPAATGIPPQQHHHHGSSPGEQPVAPMRRQTHCPVMGAAINPDLFVDVDGQRIFVCCPGCDQRILEQPQHYLAAMAEAGVTPFRLQTHCPVMGGAINRDFFYDYDGHRIYVCCPGCIDAVRQRAEHIIAEHYTKGIVFEKAAP